MPPVRVPAVEARGHGRVEQRQQCGDGPARWNVDDTVTGVEGDRGQHGTRHDRALRQPRALQRAACRQVAVTRDDQAALLGMQQKIDECPAEGRHEIRHRRDVDEGHVHRDAAPPHVRRFRCPRLDDPAEQADPARRIRITLPHRVFDDVGDVVECCAFGTLVRGGHGRHRVGVDERVRAVDHVECPHQPLEGVPVGAPRSRPRRQAHAVPEPPGQAEQVDRTPVAQLGFGGAYRRTVRRAACAAASGNRRRPCWRPPPAARRTIRRPSART